MKIKLFFLEEKNHHIQVTVNKTVYKVENGFIDVNVKERKNVIKIDVSNPKQSLFKRVGYCFRFHEKDSKDIIQYKKCFNSYTVVYELKLHRDAELTFEIVDRFIVNPYATDDRYLELQLKNKSNVTIDKKSEVKIAKPDVKKAIIFDIVLLTLRVILSVFICVGLSMGTYHYRFEMKTIFQGDMIWFVIAGYLLFLVLYLSSVFTRYIKYFKRLLMISG